MTAVSLADLLAQLARELDAEPDPTRLLQHVIEAAVRDVAGVEHAGVTLLEHHAVSTPAANSDLARRVDQEQYRLREGPCLQAALDGLDFIRVDDLAAETRWPRFTPQALRLGVRAVLSIQLYARGEVSGALNLYATRPDPFTAESLPMAGLLATHAAVALAATRKELNLQTALESRDVIGQAKGILMERFKITSTEAFQLLVRASQHRGLKLRAVADELAATGELRD